MTEKDKDTNAGGFHYSYSAKEQEELRQLRDKYAPREETKLERLHRLDRSVTQRAQTVSLLFGVIGVLVLGLGMSLIMTDIAATLHVDARYATLIGVVIGVLGGVLAALAYPVHELVLRRERARRAEEILRLTDELMK